MSNFMMIHTTKTSDEDQSSPSLAPPPSNPAICCPIIDLADLIGRLFLEDQDNMERRCVCMVKRVDGHVFLDLLGGKCIGLDIGLFTMMCTKQLVFTAKNICEWGAMPEMSLNCTSV
jgi:hypothetical protein